MRPYTLWPLPAGGRNLWAFSKKTSIFTKSTPPILNARLSAIKSRLVGIQHIRRGFGGGGLPQRGVGLEAPQEKDYHLIEFENQHGNRNIKINYSAIRKGPMSGSEFLSEKSILWYEKMVDTYRNVLSDEEKRHLQDWERENLKDEGLSTSDWPGWKKHIGLPPWKIGAN